MIDYYEYAEEWISCGVSVTSILRILGLKKSTYYRKKNIKVHGQRLASKVDGYIPGYSYNLDNKRVNDILIQKYIAEIKADEYGKHYGYKKVTAILKRKYLLIISKKKVYRLMKVMGIINSRTERVRKYKRVCKNHKISKSNQLWEMDTKYVFIAGTRQVAYLTSIIDIFDRSIIACNLSLSANTSAAEIVTLMALYNRGLKNNVDGYNNKRIHSSIDYRTPTEFYNLKNCNFKNNLVISV